MENLHFNVLQVLVLFFLSVCQCQNKPEIQVGLENSAGIVGEHINLYVRAKKYLESDYLAFLYAPDGSLDSIWAENNPDNIIDPAKFSVEWNVEQDPSDGTAFIGEYNLTITADTTLGLKYRAHFMLDTDIETTADVVVLESLGCPPAGEEKDENVEIMVACDTYFYGYKQPTMKWFNENGEVPGNVITIDEEDMTHITATVNITAAAEHDEMTFYCRLTFEQDVDENELPPEFEDVCTTYYYVKHGASNVKTYPDKDNFPDGIIQVNEGDIINCSADGRPLPTYVWYYDDNVPSEPGQNLFIDSRFLRNGESVYARCEAINYINGQESKSDTEINFIASEVDNGPPASAGTPGWVIAIAVIIPLLVIGVIVVLVYFLKIRKTDDSKGKQKPVPTNDPWDERANAHHKANDEVVQAAGQVRSPIYKQPANQAMMPQADMGSRAPHHQEPNFHPINYPEHTDRSNHPDAPVPRSRPPTQSNNNPYHVISQSQQYNPPPRKSVPAGIPLPHMGQPPQPPHPAPRPRTPASREQSLASDHEMIPEDTIV